MNVTLNQLGIGVVGLFGQSSVELALLTALVLMANRVLPLQSPALRHFIWVLVLLAGRRFGNQLVSDTICPNEFGIATTIFGFVLCAFGSIC